MNFPTTISMVRIGAVIKNSKVRSFRSSASRRMVKMGRINSKTNRMLVNRFRKTKSFRLICSVLPCICIN